MNRAYKKSFKKANRKSTRGINKSWKKGECSTYNPKFNKHRQDAKKKSVFRNEGQGNLTVDKLARHNRILNDKIMNDDATSIGGDTAITAFTNCSLPTFNRVMNNWNSGSLIHKEMIAVLAAVTEVLRANGGKETETEYFAALMTTLDVVETDEALSAVICLLSMVVKKLSPSVLKIQAESTSDIFLKLLIKYMNTEHGTLLKNLLSILCNFLKVKSVWKESSEDYNVLLEFTTHIKPKIRKVAKEAVHTLLVENLSESSQHSAAIITANFLVQKLEENGSTDSPVLFHALTLLKDVIGVFPKASIKLSCETVLRVMTLSNSLVASSCLKVFQGLFSSNSKPDNLPVELNARIIMALYDYQPNINNSISLHDWLESMNLAFMNLHRLDVKLCLSHLPKFFEVCVKCWLSDKEDAISSVASVLKNLLQECVRPESSEFQQALMEDPVNNFMHRMFHFVEDAFSYQYQKAWKCIFGVMATFFQVMGKHCYTVMLKCLRSLADMHDSYNFPYITEVEKAIGVAITHMGPHIVLQAIPLDIDYDSAKPEFSRSWLLPLLRDNIKQTKLTFFINHFLPLAAKLKNKVLTLEKTKKIIESKLYDVICSQIWSLLPGFCTEPTDLKECFKDVARTLGVLLKDEPSLRITVLKSIRLLINKNMENEENKLELCKFSKNFLPILFNLYTTESENKAEELVRGAVYETCKVYLQITEKELCHTFFSKCMERLKNGKVEPFLLQALIDLNKAILPFVDEKYIKIFYKYCKSKLQSSKNRTTLKKCYSMYSYLCSSKEEICQSFVKRNLEDIKSTLLKSAGLTPSTKALRLNCFLHIVQNLDESDKECVVAIVPEAVLCTKDTSIKARNAAYNLLVEIGHVLIKWKSDNAKEGIREYISLLLAGLAGNAFLMSATILAIGRVMYEFKDEMESDILHLLIENMGMLLASENREVIVSALSFMKILFATIDTLDLAQHVEFIIKSITKISEGSQKKLRFKSKEIFVKLIRKFGYEMIAKMTPEKYQILLNNIRKNEARKKKERSKKQKDIDDDEEEHDVKRKSDDMQAILEDSDDEIEFDEEPKKSHKKPNKKQKRNTDPCIEEQDDEIVDFMDSSINKKILAGNPQKTVAKAKLPSTSFPVSEDGKFIIVDEEDDAISRNEMSTDGRASVLKELGSMKRNKRKFRGSDEDNESETETPVVKRGIRRNVKKAGTKKSHSGEMYKSKKAGGDVKKGKFDPFAYLPLNRQALNKRKRIKLKGQFSNIVKAAKKGAQTGTKKRVKKNRK